MRTDIATVCLSGTLEDKLVAAADAGFDGVEIFEPDLIASPSSPGDVRVLCRDLGLSIDLYQPFRDLDSVDPSQFAANLRRAERKFDVMQELGTDTVLVCSSVGADAVTDDALLASQLGELASRAADRGLRIAYEALAWGAHVNTYEHSWDVVQRADHPALGVCLDSFHILSKGSDPAGIAGIPGSKIFFLQLADAPHLSMDVLQWSRHHRLFPGQGAFDLPAFLRPVLTAGYAGPLSLEVFNDVFRQADPGPTAVDARRSLLALAEATAAALPAQEVPRAAAVAGGAGVDPVAAPATVLSGYAFVELSAAPEEAVRLGGVLEALGFERTGRHRTKPVERWEQGRARVLVNAAGTGGAALGALAVESADPPAAALRAQRLLAPLLPRERGPAEADLAAIAAPDGTPLFFARTTGDPGPVARPDADPEGGGPGGWSGDFVPTPDGSRTGAGVTGIDHVGLAEPFDHFDEAALFYRAVLGLTPITAGEFAAPFGLVRGRALTDSARSVRLALTVARLRRGDWAPAVADPQYVAFTTEDVVTAARKAREAGAPLLAIPDNYYDDLGARLDLAPEQLATYRDLGILHTADHPDGGAYLQVSTQLLGGRLFLLLVQRLDGYDGYGWADAPVRMAAHRRNRLARTPT
ncbi:TIM barrel protein [Cryptosporangium sp. NPDC048952]|uniref:sugar phosphate isomerase/epimerase and 4-hydroxyphenylpyruvate domain-containing protein n=1 Tax=Cryptosporangium sp. NPDC048952 TaxID=3363961 RepID=UPI0037122DF3